MIITIEKPKLEEAFYLVSYPSGKKINKLEIKEGSADWNTQNISSFLLELADETSDEIVVKFGQNITEEIKDSDEQLKAIFELFSSFANEINKQ